MMIWEIKKTFFKIDTFINFDEGMDMMTPVLMSLLRDDVLLKLVMLTQVLQDHGG